MSDRSAWAFDLIDGTSGPGQRVLSTLDRIDRLIDLATKSFDDLDKSSRRAGGGFDVFVATLDHGMSVLHTVSGVIGGLFSKAWDFGQFVVNALAFKESTLTSFKLMTGSEEAAERIFDKAFQFARKTPFETETVMKSFKQLLSAGFSEEETGNVFQGLGDVGAASGFSSDVIDRLIYDFAHIKAAGVTHQHQLMQIVGATAQAGIGMKDIYAQVAKVLHIGTDQVADAISKGKLSGDQGVFAVMKAIQEHNVGGKLGSQMLSLSTTLTGLFSTLRSAPGDFFLSMDTKKMPGIEAFKGFITNLTDVLDTGKATGAKIRDTLQSFVSGAFDKLFQSFSGPQGMEKMEAALNNLVDGVRQLGASFADINFGDVAAGLVAIASALATGAVWAGKVAGFFAHFSEIDVALGKSMGDKISGFFEDIIHSAKISGRNLVAGFLEGVDEGMKLVGKGLKALGDEAIGSLKDFLMIHSPSERFAELGEMSAAGYEQGIRTSGPGVSGTVQDMVGSPRAKGRAGGGGARVEVIINVNGSTPTNAEAIAALRQAALEALTAQFEELGLELGVS